MNILTTLWPQERFECLKVEIGQCSYNYCYGKLFYRCRANVRLLISGKVLLLDYEEICSYTGNAEEYD